VATAVGLSNDRAQLARIEVRNEPSGAPYVLVDGVRLKRDVSLTDRAGWAVCVLGPPADRAGRPAVDPPAVGCDLELVEARSPAFVRDFFTAKEQRYVTAHADPDAQQAAANLVWSAKESALKVLRTGLRRDTRSVEVTLGDGPVFDGWAPLVVRAAEGGRYPGWWRRSGRFVLTVVCDGGSSGRRHRARPRSRASTR
jgi:4'-phosphopantetheinyl transferase